MNFKSFYKIRTGRTEMKRIATIAAGIATVASLAGAATPTIDGTFDGTAVWGSPIATNSNPGFSGAGATATALYVTADATYVYFGAAVTGLAGWQTYGFAIDSKAGGGNTQEPWSRQINFNFPTNTVGDAPDFVVRGIADNSWAELRTWNGTDWSTGGATNIGTSEANSSTTNGWIECRVAKSTLSMRGTNEGQVEFYLTGDNNTHGLFTSVPYDTPCTQWDNTGTPQSLTNPQASGTSFVPVTLSSLTVE